MMFIMYLASHGISSFLNGSKHEFKYNMVIWIRYILYTKKGTPLYKYFPNLYIYAPPPQPRF